jgi:hypothetical protein
MRKLTVITAIAAFFPFFIFAQDSTWKKRADTNAVAVHKDPRLDLLVKKQIQINEETTREARKAGKGYRLLVVNTNKREDAIAAKTKVYTYFPELKAYLIYQSPYFKVKVGNFKERKEAEDYQKKLRSFFPKGVFIMNDIIEMKLEKEEISRDPEPEPNPGSK